MNIIYHTRQIKTAKGFMKTTSDGTVVKVGVDTASAGNMIVRIVIESSNQRDEILLHPELLLTILTLGNQLCDANSDYFDSIEKDIDNAIR